MTRRRAALAGSIGLILAISSAACGGSSTTTVTATRTTTVTVTTSATTQSNVAAPSGSASAPRCRTSQLSLQVGTNGATGSIELYTTFTNHSQTSCSLHGYPGLGLVSRSGTPMHTVVLRTRTAVIPAVADRLVVLKPGGTANFYGSFQDVLPEPCPRAAELEVTPPNDYGHLAVKAALSPCHGVIHVSPVFAS